RGGRANGSTASGRDTDATAIVPGLRIGTHDGLSPACGIRLIVTGLRSACAGPKLIRTLLMLLTRRGRDRRPDTHARRTAINVVQADDADPGRCRRAGRGHSPAPASLPAVEPVRDRGTRAFRGRPTRILAGNRVHRHRPGPQGSRLLHDPRLGTETALLARVRRLRRDRVGLPAPHRITAEDRHRGPLRRSGLLSDYQLHVVVGAGPA